MNDSDDRELVELAEQALGAWAPDPERTARVKAALLEEAVVTPQGRAAEPSDDGFQRWPWVVVGVAAAAAAAAVFAPWVVPRPPPAPVASGSSAASTIATVTASGNATFERDSDLEANREAVRLKHGRILVDAPVHLRRQVMVVSADAQVELQGASAEVEVQTGVLQRVSVLGGQVILRRPSRADVILEAGETWSRAAARKARTSKRRPSALRAKVPAASTADTPQAGVRSPDARAQGSTTELERVSRGSARPPDPSRVAMARTNKAGAGVINEDDIAPPFQATGTSPSEVAFQRGWTAFSRRRYDEAAAAFAGADTPESPVVEEARYWRAIALVKADRREPAEAALRAFIAGHADSPRVDEAALLLGRLRLLANDPGSARPWLIQAQQSPRATVRQRAASLLRGLTP